MMHGEVSLKHPDGSVERWQVEFSNDAEYDWFEVKLGDLVTEYMPYEEAEELV